MVLRRGVARPGASLYLSQLPLVLHGSFPIRFYAVKTNCCFSGVSTYMANTKERATCWSVTINNPTPADDEAIALARQKGWIVFGQIEKGEEGTPHYQLMLRTPQVRWSAVKKHFDRAHIEVAHDPIALQKYVGKVESRVGNLPSTDKYPSMSKLWELIYQRNNTGSNDGWDMTELPGDVRLYNEGMRRFMDTAPLEWFDIQVRHLIAEGYHVESMAVNPQVRACWKNYWGQIMIRVATAEFNSELENTTKEDANEVEIPSLQEAGDASQPSPPSLERP